MFMLWKGRGGFMRFVNGGEGEGGEERRREERIEEEEEDMGGFHDDNKSTN